MKPYYVSRSIINFELEADHKAPCLLSGTVSRSSSMKALVALLGLITACFLPGGQGRMEMWGLIVGYHLRTSLTGEAGNTNTYNRSMVLNEY